jgi:hypothetical protein
MSTDPLEPIARLGQRLAEEAKKIGLRLVQFAVLPDPGGEHVIRTAFVPDESGPVSTPDPEFDELIRAQERMENEEKARKAREELEQFRKNLEEPGGSFLD